MKRRMDPYERDARAFVARGFHEGSLAEFERAQKLVWAAEDRRRARLARRVAWLGVLPWPITLLLIVLAGVAVAAFWEQIVIVAVLTGIVWAVARWHRPRTVEAEMVAPPDINRRQQDRSILQMHLPAEVRAVVTGLNHARTKTYLDALDMRVISAPSRRALEGRDIVEAQLPGGDIRPEDVDVVRLGQTLGFEADRVRRMPAPAGLLMVELLHTRPADLVVPAWPALGRVTSWADPCPIGVDDLGAPVEVPLMGARVMVSGQSGSGKTVTLRLLAMYAAADPTVRLHLHDYKGDGDFAALAGRAASYHATGADVPDEVVNDLRAIRDRMRAHREAVRRGESPEVVPTVLVIDECQALASKKEALGIVEEIARQGRSVGYSLLLGSQLATQKSVPVAVLAQCDVRVVMRQGAAWAGEQLLQDSTVDVLGLPNGHAQVWDMRTSRRSRVGVHYVDDEGAQVHMRGVPALPPVPVLPVLAASRVGDVDDDVEGVDDPDAPGGGANLLRDVLDVIGDRSGATWDELVVSLDIDKDELRAQLRAHGIKSQKFRNGDLVHNGVRRVDVVAALEQGPEHDPEQ